MKYMIGYDLLMLQKYGIKLPICVSPEKHVILVGGSGSGKSSLAIMMIYKMLQNNSVDLTICDFKASHELKGITSKYAEFADCYDTICSFYEDFLKTPEGGSGQPKLLIIDEIAGLLSHLTLNNKKQADEIRQMMSSILMLGRSRRVFLALIMQRFSANIFPASSGAADNFHVCIGLGRLTVDGRKSLFAGEHFPEEDSIQYGTGKGIILIDGEPLRAIAVPKINKEKLLSLIHNTKGAQR